MLPNALFADPSVFVLDDGLRRKQGALGFHVGHAFDRGANGHELQEVAHLVDVGLDTHDIVGTNRVGFGSDQAKGVPRAS